MATPQSPRVSALLQRLDAERKRHKRATLREIGLLRSATDTAAIKRILFARGQLSGVEAAIEMVRNEYQRKA